ncbi:hypothetical protein BH11GEM1_BH11GEM1_10570 [soil metagenome]
MARYKRRHSGSSRSRKELNHASVRVFDGGLHPGSQQSGDADPNARFIAGWTTLVDLMKLDVERPNTLVNFNALAQREPSLTQIVALPDGGIRIGALVRRQPGAFPSGNLSALTTWPEGNSREWVAKSGSLEAKSGTVLSTRAPAAV